MALKVDNRGTNPKDERARVERRARRERCRIVGRRRRRLNAFCFRGGRSLPQKRTENPALASGGEAAKAVADKTGEVNPVVVERNALGGGSEEDVLSITRRVDVGGEHVGVLV